MTTGRNFDEVLRVIDSLQLTAKYKVATPVNWKQGEDVIIAGSVTDEEAQARYTRRAGRRQALHPHRAPAEGVRARFDRRVMAERPSEELSVAMVRPLCGADRSWRRRQPPSPQRGCQARDFRLGHVQNFLEPRLRRLRFSVALSPVGRTCHICSPGSDVLDGAGGDRGARGRVDWSVLECASRRGIGVRA